LPGRPVPLATPPAHEERGPPEERRITDERCAREERRVAEERQDRRTAEERPAHDEHQQREEGRRAPIFQAETLRQARSPSGTTPLQQHFSPAKLLFTYRSARTKVVRF